MYAAVVLIQIIAVSLGGYINFVLEEPCPEKYYGSPKCYTYTYRTNNPSKRNLKRLLFLLNPKLCIMAHILYLLLFGDNPHRTIKMKTRFMIAVGEFIPSSIVIHDTTHRGDDTRPYI